MKTREQIGVRTKSFPATAFVTVWALAAWTTALTGAGLGDARAADSPYCGSWGLTRPGGWPAWLGVEEDQGQLKARLVRMDGTFGPLPAARLEDGKLVMSRRPFGGDFVETISATLEGDTLKSVKVTPGPNGQGQTKFQFTGRRLPPMPLAPDLSKLKLLIGILRTCHSGKVYRASIRLRISFRVSSGFKPFRCWIRSV